MENAKKIITNVLLAFVLISFGYVLGKHSVDVEQKNITVDSDDKIIVYYFHSSFRCETCNSIESMTKELLDSLYVDKLKDETMQWREVDFQQNEQLADSYGVAASCVVVAEQRDGKIVRFAKLDKVWDFISQKEKFDEYISSAIEEYVK